MKYKIWTVLEWIDNNINHAIVDRLYDISDNLYSESDFLTNMWLKTSWAYCQWVHNEALEWRDK